MPSLYTAPEVLEPLDADSGKEGKKCNHRIVIARPISEINNISARAIKNIKIRPFPKSGFHKMKE